MSYSWDSAAHRRWVRSLSENLVKAGVGVILDEWDTYLGMDLTEFMERGIRDSDFVVVVCTPLYAKKANQREGGAGYETSVITGELFQRVSDRGKFVPVLRKGTPDKALPGYLANSLFVDFRRDDTFINSIERLLRHIYRRPEHRPPQLGNAPDFTFRSFQVLTQEVSSSASRNLNEALIAQTYGLSISKLDAMISQKQEQLKNLPRDEPLWRMGARFRNLDIQKLRSKIQDELAYLQEKRAKVARKEGDQ